MSEARRISTVTAIAVALATAAGAAGAAGARSAERWRDPALDRPTHTRQWPIRYRAHTGALRRAVVLLPKWYGRRLHPAIPLVISPHGRGVDGTANSRLWGDLPAVGSFAVVSPDGAGERLPDYSWGAPGQIDDLARMPALVRRALPWLRVDRTRIYAVGGSMGGQESLLLLARYPRLLAGVAAFDSVVDLAHQYHQFPRIPCNARCTAALGEPLGSKLQRLARIEIGGSPASAPLRYAARSPLTYARAIAASCVPLQLWWSRRDRIVVDSGIQSARLLRELRRLNPGAAVEGFAGTWVHSAEMRASTRLPFALARLGLMSAAFDGPWGSDGATVLRAPRTPCSV